MSDLLLFAPVASHPFGSGVARALGLDLAPLEERSFEDAEHKARPLCNVRGGDVYVVHALHGGLDQSVNDRLVRLLFLIGTLKDAGAGRVTAVTPYLAYARKDRRTKPRDPVTTRYVAQLFEAVGLDRIVTLDVHNVAAYQNAFRCRAEHLEAAPLFVAHLAPLLGGGPVTVVSPDAGGIKRADAFRRRLAAALARPVGAGFVEKYRSGGVVSGDAFVGDVAHATALVVDDLISGGTTMARAARACRDHGAQRVHAIATHGLFAAGAEAALVTSHIDSVLVTNSVSGRTLAPALAAKVATLDASALVADAIARLHRDEPIGGVDA